MSSAEAAEPPEPAKATVYRCTRCGVESAERECFIVPGRYARPPRDTRCLACEQARLVPNTQRSLRIALVSLLLPFVIYVGAGRGLTGLSAWVIVLVCVMQPVVTVLHELGHAIAATVTGLEVPSVELGFGKRVWRGEVAGTFIVFRRWPFSGRTLLGARTTHFLRLRLWLTTLAGPAVNVLVMAAAVHWWDYLVGVVGVPLLMFWLIINGMMLGVTLLPHRYNSAGRRMRSDGLGLLEIPRLTEAQIAHHLVSAPIARVLANLEGQDYAGAIAECLQGLARGPKDQWLRVMLAGCYNRRGEYAAGLEVDAPMLEESAITVPIVRAAIQNNIAFSLLMMNLKSPDRGALSRADELSKSAFQAVSLCAFSPIYSGPSSGSNWARRCGP
jgi:hypothetical protein